jgi:tetratricopeptide (TPR) repeat protein
MAKRIIIISSFPICIVFVVLAFVFALRPSSPAYGLLGQAGQVGIGRGQPAAGMSIDSATAQIFSFVEAGNLAEADAATDKLVADYAGDANLPSAIMTIADTYAWRKMYDRSERLCRLVIDKSAEADKSPENQWAAKARLGLARLEILSFIEEKKYLTAQQQVNSMVADFNNEPNLPATLFHIGLEFFWKEQFDKSKDVFDRLADNFPNSSVGQKAKLWSARINICALIEKTPRLNWGQAKDEEVVADINRMISNFKDDAGLPEAVYWTSKVFEWVKGDAVDGGATRFEVPKSIYQRLATEFGDSSYGQQAGQDYKRLTHRIKIFTLIGEADQNEINAAIENMVVEFKGRPEIIASELCWIGHEYEDRSALAKVYVAVGEAVPDILEDRLAKYALAGRIYERILQDYPDIAEAKEARLDVYRVDMDILIEKADINEANALTDKFIADFNGDPYLGKCLGQIAIQYYMQGMVFKQQNRGEQKQCFEKSEDLLQRVIDNNTADDFGMAYYYAASSRQQLGRWDDAAAYYQKVVDDYPDYEKAGGAQCAVGWCYEMLVSTGKIPKEQAEPIIEEAYKAVLTNYPDCPIAHYAARRLGDISIEKGDKAGAIAYYKQFLELASPEHYQLAAIKAKLEQLEKSAIKGGTNPSTSLRTDKEGISQ